ncbi:hypothetical protein [Angustibacter aerolatus]
MTSGGGADVGQQVWQLPDAELRALVEQTERRGRRGAGAGRRGR